MLDRGCLLLSQMNKGFIDTFNNGRGSASVQNA